MTATRSRSPDLTAAALWLYRIVILPLTCLYLAIVGLGLLALGFSALRALLGALGLMSGGAFDWMPE